ncbi:PPE family protein [Mycobacterium sp. UM_WGJ]|uniref:PPE family protein n=1 Tax=unclassified Mycobacterium TaxID=2642494 RepID=UPI00350F0FAF
MPPETHSAMLAAGPGPGPLLAAAAEWQRLSVIYDDTAAGLTRVLAAVQSSHWQGPSATAYLSAHTPYLTWLEQAAADSATTAAQHQTAASAYSAAVASMPSLDELAANHAVHTVLLATNFFGVNTVPIAANEADYTRMWVQAAETMSVYQGTATAAVAANPQIRPAPPIVSNPAAATSPAGAEDPNWLQELTRLITELLDNAGNVEELLRIFEDFFQNLGFNPVIATFLAAVALIAYDVLWYPYYASYGLLLLPFFAPALSALSALKLLPLLNGQQIPADKGPAIVAPLAGEGSVDIPVTAIAAPPAAAGSSAGLGGTAGAPGPSAPAVIPSPDGVAALIPYVVSGWGPPGVETGPKDDMTASNSVAASSRTTAPRTVAADVRGRRNRRSTGRVRMHGNRYEFLQAGDGAVMATESDARPAERPEAIAAVVASTRAAGLTGHADEIRRVPMLPTSWSASDQVEQLTQPMKEGKEE